jgi:hypothetical protein
MMYSSQRGSMGSPATFVPHPRQPRPHHQEVTLGALNSNYEAIAVLSHTVVCCKAQITTSHRQDRCCHVMTAFLRRNDGDFWMASLA